MSFDHHVNGVMVRADPVVDPGAYDRAVVERTSYASALFDALREMSVDGPGVTRPSYCDGEQRAHDHLAGLARGLDLTVEADAAGNLLMRWPGRNRSLPEWITGSHLDSVHQGGNFDGAAGVVAGITAVAALKDAGFVPERTLTVAAWRAEECSTWFVGRHGGHLGSRAALGLLDPSELETATHITTGLSLGEMIERAGFDPARLTDPDPLLPAAAVAGYTELHIEQGPVLDMREIPVGIVSAIRGCYRARNARVEGEYSHSGAVPREYRSDAAFALAELVMSLDREWTRREDADEDLVVTFGKMTTNPDLHAIVKVPGEVDFALDIRSESLQVLDEVEATLRDEAERIGLERRVRFLLDPIDRVRPAVMDCGLREDLRAAAEELAISALDMPSGGGHDAADFWEVGIPSSMLFVRNANGSHNPHEAMEIDDFMQATRVLARFLARRCGPSGL